MSNIRKWKNVLHVHILMSIRDLVENGDIAESSWNEYWMYFCRNWLQRLETEMSLFAGWQKQWRVRHVGTAALQEAVED